MTTFANRIIIITSHNSCSYGVTKYSKARYVRAREYAARGNEVSSSYSNIFLIHYKRNQPNGPQKLCKYLYIALHYLLYLGIPIFICISPTLLRRNFHRHFLQLGERFTISTSARRYTCRRYRGSRAVPLVCRPRELTTPFPAHLYFIFLDST